MRAASALYPEPRIRGIGPAGHPYPESITRGTGAASDPYPEFIFSGTGAASKLYPEIAVSFDVFVEEITICNEHVDKHLYLHMIFNSFGTIRSAFWNQKGC